MTDTDFWCHVFLAVLNGTMPKIGGEKGVSGLNIEAIAECADKAVEMRRERFRK